MFISTSINVRGTAIDHLKAIKDFFLNNTVAPFELVDEMLDGGNVKQYINLKRNKMYVKFETINTYTVSTNSGALSVYVYDENEYLYSKTKYNNAQITSQSTGTADNVVIERTINILISNSDTEEEICIIGVFPYNSNIKKFFSNTINTAFFVVYFEEKNFMFSFSAQNTNRSFKRISDGTSVYLRELSLTPQDISKLIVVDKAEVYKANTMEHLEFLSPLISVGGATAGYSYTINGKTYLCIQDNICIPIGEKSEYTPTTESEA